MAPLIECDDRRLARTAMPLDRSVLPATVGSSVQFPSSVGDCEWLLQPPRHDEHTHQRVALGGMPASSFLILNAG